jgi:hypothetical protein
MPDQKDDPAPKEPTTFLTLPREIRQQILLQAYNTPQMPGLLYFMCRAKPPHQASHLRQRTQMALGKWTIEQEQQMRLRAESLRGLHAACAGDMDFVQGKWLEALEEQVENVRRQIDVVLPAR